MPDESPFENKLNNEQVLYKKHSSIIKDENEDEKLRSAWTAMFLQNKGF